MKTDTKTTEREVILDGVGVAGGIAIGPAHVVESGTLNVPESAASGRGGTWISP
jgi:hypothetical protein